MLSLCEIKDKIKNLEDIKNRECDLVYVYDEYGDMYYCVKDIRIDSENDIVVDLCSCCGDFI